MFGLSSKHDISNQQTGYKTVGILKTPKNIFLNPRTCYKVAAEGNIDAYVFAKTLAALNKHPVLLNYKANAIGYRILLGLTDNKYRKLFNAAIRANFASFEGDNLRIIGLKAEKKRYKARLKHYTLIKVADIKQFIYISTFKKNQALQISSIRYKEKQSCLRSSTTSAAPKNEFNLIAKKQINQNVTLSYRTAARLMGLNLSAAYYQVKALKEFGLTTINEKIEISKQLFIDALKSGSHAVRHDKEIAKFYLVMPTKVTFDKFYQKQVVNNFNKPAVKSYSFYCNDIA